MSPDMDISQGVLAHWLSLARHTPLGVLCDLDGTLLPFVATPSESRLPPGLAELLSGLAALPGLSLAIVSGRPRETWSDCWPRSRAPGWSPSMAAGGVARGAWEACHRPAARGRRATGRELRQLAARSRAPWSSARLGPSTSTSGWSRSWSERLCW